MKPPHFHFAVFCFLSGASLVALIASQFATSGFLAMGAVVAIIAYKAEKIGL